MSSVRGKKRAIGWILQLCKDSLEKTLMLGRDWGQEEKGMTEMRWLDGITDSMDMFG